MPDIKMRVGAQIRRYRKANQMTIETLAQNVHKGKSTVSKYEKGEIAVDVETLEEIACALHITVAQLFQSESRDQAPAQQDGVFAHREFMYFYDGRAKRVSKSVLEHYYTDKKERMKAVLFYDVASLEDSGRCRALYTGYMTQYAFISNYSFENQKNSTEQAFLYSFDSMELSEHKTGVLSGLSFRTLRPVSLKVVLSAVPLEEDGTFISGLMLTKEDFRLTKKYNMLTLDRML